MGCSVTSKTLNSFGDFPPTLPRFTQSESSSIDQYKSIDLVLSFLISLKRGVGPASPFSP
nr:MAG TPA: hypothetical protein [Crassvirales sp.]